MALVLTDKQTDRQPDGRTDVVSTSSVALLLTGMLHGSTI